MKLVCPPFKGENKGHYSAGVISKGMLYVSGQLSIDPDTREVCKGDIKDHTRLALDNVDRVLKEAGVRRDQVVFCRVYTPSVEYWGPINEVYAEFFGDHKPGRVVVSTTDLHFGCLFRLGIRDPKHTASLHECEFDFNDEATLYGSTLMVLIALNRLKAVNA